MRTKIYSLAALFFTMLLFLGACKKASTVGRAIQQKLACDVSRYSVSAYDNQSGVVDDVNLFQKIYDAAGKNVTEIQCAFFEPYSPYGVDIGGSFLFGPTHDLLVYKNGSSLILRDKTNSTDTAMVAILNGAGRPVSCILSLQGVLTDDSHLVDTETFVYKGSRIFSVQGTLSGLTDTVRYDSLGNLLSFAGNTYIYDYYRPTVESFYMTDYEAKDHGYYLLQYLGYFPEVTNTSNIRSNLSNSYLMDAANMGEEQYDADGRLVGFNTHFVQGYNFGSGSWSQAVTYHCQ